MSGLADRLRRSFVADPNSGLDPIIIYPEHTRNLSALRPAAVLVPIIDAPEPRVVLTVRHAGLRDHAGQVAFPGGRIDPGDEGPIAAALREAWEEIALPSDRVDIVAATRSYATGSGYLITPVIGVIPDGLMLSRQEAEVASVFEVPLVHLLDESKQLLKSVMVEDVEHHYYEIDWPHERIWGVTARLIVDLSHRLREAIGSPA